MTASMPAPEGLVRGPGKVSRVDAAGVGDQRAPERAKALFQTRLLGLKLGGQRT